MFNRDSSSPELFSLWLPNYSFWPSWSFTLYITVLVFIKDPRGPLCRFLKIFFFLSSLLHLGILPLSIQLQQTPWTLTPVRLLYTAWEPLPCSAIQKVSLGRGNAIIRVSLIFLLWDYNLQLPIVRYLIAVVSYSFLFSSCLRWDAKPCPC